MANLSKQIILNCEKLETRCALLSNGRLEEYHIERAGTSVKSGSIYLGKIVNLEPSLQAAFVDIGAEKNAFLHYHDMLPGADDMLEHQQESIAAEIVSTREKRTTSGKVVNRNEVQAGKALEMKAQELARRRKKLTSQDIPEFFKAGMELLVQVVKAPIGTKGARVSTNLSIPGRYLVILPYSAHIGLSTKIENETERARLKKILGELEVPEGVGLICRTVGEGRKSIFFKRDLEILLDYWRKIETAMNEKKAPLLVFSEPNLVERTVRDFMTEDISEIIVDDKNSYRHIHGELKRFGGLRMAAKVKSYTGTNPIFEEFKVGQQLAEVYNRVVKLPSGGYICIDETEALIAIDVNSGKAGRQKIEQDEFILQTNLEAAEEIARQLRLRDIGGLVVLDFIDMRGARDREEVYKTMKKLAKEDRAKTKVIPVSRLGLMEMTRQREHESLQDTVYNQCPYCHGSGYVKSPETMSVEIQRRLHEILRQSKYKKVPLRVVMHPEVLARLKNEDSDHLVEIEEKYHHDLTFRADAELHCEEFHIIDPETNLEID